MSKKQKRQTSRSTPTTAAPAGNNGSVTTIKRTITTGPAEFNPDYTLVISDLKRIGILAASFIAVLVILSFIF